MEEMKNTKEPEEIPESPNYLRKRLAVKCERPVVKRWPYV